MKLHKLFMSVATVGLLVGASGAATARDDCATFEGRTVIGQTLDEFVIDENTGLDCTVLSSTVNGDVLVSSESGAFTMKASVVNGNLQVSNTIGVYLVDNEVIRAPETSGGNLTVGSTGLATVLGNNVSGGGNLEVIDDFEGDGSCTNEATVYVAGNLVLNGNLKVACNRTATVRQNTVTNGNIECSDNIELDSADNESLGGTVSCSRSFQQEGEQEE